MRITGLTITVIVLLVASVQAAELKSAAAVLERYQQALGGADAIAGVQSETARGEIEGSGIQAKATFVSYAKPFKSLFKVTRADGTEIVSGFDGKISWSITPQGATIDRDTPLESARRDADLQYALHQPDYFQKLELAGIADFEDRRCYRLHGTTHWGKDNNQFYDLETGLLAGYRFQSDDASSAPATLVFRDYKRFGTRLAPTKMILQTKDFKRIFTRLSLSDDPLPDSLFDLPPAVKALSH